MRVLLAVAVAVGLVTLTGCEEDDPAVSRSDAESTTPDTGTGGDGMDAATPVGDAGTGGMDAATEPTVKVTRDHLADAGTGPLNYDDPALWVCRKGNDPNECHMNLDATEILKDGSRKVVPHQRAAEPKFDCFYIYPTVATMGGGNMTNFSNITAVLDPLRSQVARFTRVCEVYAPLYRQISLSRDADGGIIRAGDPALAVGDVLAAFDHYLSKLSQGRKFVIMGHSQGSSMAIELLKRKIDNDPAVRGRMISALLLGSGPVTPPDKPVGGSFQNIPVCKTKGETGCLIAFVTYDQAAPPQAANALFGRTTDAGVVACTEPAALLGQTGNYRGSYFPLTTSNPTFMSPGFRPMDATTPFMLYRDYFRGQCVNKDGFSYLELSINKSADDQREVPPYRNPALEMTGWGLHLVDYNPSIDELIELVSSQAAAAK